MKKVLILSLGMFALGFDAYIVAGIIPGISETYQRDVSQVGLAVSMFTLFYAISAPVFASILAGKPLKKYCYTLCSFSLLQTALQQLLLHLPFCSYLGLLQVLGQVCFLH